MCEILIRVIDKTHPDPVEDVLCTKRGDVLAVQEDGWLWGTGDQSNPDWRIIKLPNIGVELFYDMLQRDEDANGVMLRKRKRFLNINSLPNQAKNKIMNATEPITFNVTEQQALNAIKETKAELQVTVG